MKRLDDKFYVEDINDMSSVFESEGFRTKDNLVKKFINYVKKVKNYTKEKFKEGLLSLFSRMNEESQETIISSLERLETESVLEENTLLLEDSTLKKIGKKIVGEAFPSLAFYPALQVFMYLDSIITGGFGTLSGAEQKRFVVYAAMFVGLTSVKITKDLLSEKKSSSKVDYKKGEEEKKED